MLLISLACVAGCSSGSSSSDVTVPTVAADAVLIQLGSYVVGGVPDEFVVGPEIVVYGDGSVYAELYVGVENGEASLRLVTGRLGESQLQDVFEAAASLPAPGVVGASASRAMWSRSTRRRARTTCRSTRTCRPSADRARPPRRHRVGAASPATPNELRR